MAVKKKINYIDNERFAEAMREHRLKVEAAKAAGESPRVPVTDYIGICFTKIAQKLSLRPNFIGYSYRDEMVACAVETMLTNAHHFNPMAQTRSGTPNPFSYFTLVAWRAFIHRITYEKKQEYIKYKYTENQSILGDIVTGDGLGKAFNSRDTVDLTHDYYQKLADLFEKPKADKKIGLDKFIVSEDEEIDIGELELPKLEDEDE